MLPWQTVHRRPWSLASLASVALGAALWVTLTPQASAQDEPPPGSEAEPFIESVRTAVVNVDVYVTDRDGNPVTGLGPEDFELYEDCLLYTSPSPRD